MLKKLLITTAVSGVVISGAIAQSQTPTAPAANAPAAKEQNAPAAKDQNAPAAKEQSATKESTSASGANFITSQGADQLVFTKFKGAEVRGPDNASIGSVNDLLFDGNGKIIGVVIGVGGFLGIGAKNVAIDMTAFNIVPGDSGSNGTNSTPTESDPSNVKLKVAWTKDQLRDAPDFQYYKSPARSAGTSSPATTGSAPRPMSPGSPRPQ
jgi:PRC-barrel domain